MFIGSRSAAAEGPVECEAEPLPAKPEYSPTELDDFVAAIRKMVILEHLSGAEWGAECEDAIRAWLMDTDHLMLAFHVSEQRRVRASLSFPEEKVEDVFYFLREQSQIFALDSFHDDVTFGRTYDVDGHMLALIEHLYVPALFGRLDGSENVQAKFKKSVYEFLAKSTAWHHKMSGLTVLYVPSEVQAVDEEAAAIDSDFVERLEFVAEHWIDQLRVALSDDEQIAPFLLLAPHDELDFWKYRRESNVCLARSDR